jgi:hypothetical protein
MIKERLSVLICGALLFVSPSSVFAAAKAGDISVRTIYFADGTSQSTATLQGPAGPQGSIGPEGLVGPIGPTGLQGPAGTDGYNSLLLMTDEIAGPNCANGGIKIQVGLDQNKNGALDSGEVLQTKYVCYGTTSVTPPLTPITVTASPSTQTINSFINVTASLPSNYYSGVYFSTSGPCVLYGSYASGTGVNESAIAGIASVALTSSYDRPCIVYATYNDGSKQVTGSAVATFVPVSDTTPATTPAPITVTASPSTQTINSFINVTASLPSNYYSSVYFSTSGSCVLYGSYASGTGVNENTIAGIASVALTSSSERPCIVYATYYDGIKQANITGSAVATFVTQAP